MPNMDGTGPSRAGYPMRGGMSRRQGNRCGMSQGRGMYGGDHPRLAGCRCGLGPCAQYAPDEKTALEARKDALRRSLDELEKRLETL